MSRTILTAGTVITMDPGRPRAQAVAVSDGRIAAVGSLAQCQAECPDAEVIDTGAGALLPGFVEPHSHPVMSGVATQAITLDQAVRAHTIDAARTLHRDKLIGSVEVGKLADFTELTADPYTVDPAELADKAQVSGTWLSGERIDLGAFVGAVSNADPGRHADLADQPRRTCC